MKRMKTRPNKMTTKLITATTILAGLVALGLGGMLYATDNATSGLLRLDDKAVVALGRQVYMDQCAACHGDNLQGQPDWQTRNEDGRLPAPPHDETGHTWHHADELLFGITKFGLREFANLADYETDMPVYKEVLSDEEIIAVLSYIKSTWPAEIRQLHDQRNAMK